jgi:carbon-monoxide dehydrogenase small subunit
MLISARDLVLRLAVPDERSVRVGLSGNLCRCTGYVGIVRAVRSVIDQRRKRGVPPVSGGGRSALGPVGSGNGTNTSTLNPVRAPATRTEARHLDNSGAIIPVCLSQIKSGHTGDAVRRGLGGKEYALPS